MDSYQDLLDAANARELARESAEWKRKKEAQQQYENAAKDAHKVRQAGHLLLDSILPSWEEMSLSSQRRLIADAISVAKNPSISGAELRILDQERLMASGDTEHEDLQLGSEPFQSVERVVLENLRANLKKA